MHAIALDGESLTIEDVVAVARGRPGHPRVTLPAVTVAKLERSRAALERALAGGEPIYGVTTGFGALQGRPVAPAHARQLQLNVVRSHAAGVGPPLETDVVRAMLLLRANSLAKGQSGVRPQLVALLVELLNRGVHPVVPSRGSVGASGDLAPLAHLALVLLGEGEATLAAGADESSAPRPAAEALRWAGLEPLAGLEPKEGLALVNGTAQMAALLALALVDAERLAATADLCAALAMEALRARLDPFAEATLRLRPHPGALAVGAHVRRLLAGSTLVTVSHPGLMDGLCARPADSLAGPDGVQDPYSLRCVPQVHGAVRDALAHVRAVLAIELNSANDNPLVLELADRAPRPGAAEGAEGADPGAPEVAVVSQGNFHGEPLALAANYLAAALAALGTISERRTALLVAGRAGLPPFLTPSPGLTSGLMLAQYTAAALVAENKVLAHPTSADTIPTSAGWEDHVSFGATAALAARQVVANVEAVLAIELLAAAQALDLRRRVTPEGQPAPAIARAHAVVRSRVPFLEDDAPLAGHIEALRALVRAGTLLDAAASAE